MIGKGRGDNGYTDIIGPGRVPKYDPRAEALGSIDEATSTLGIVRALSKGEINGLIKDIQEDLQTLMTEIASLDKPKKIIGKESIKKIESLIERYEKETEIPSSFTLPGENLLSAFLHLARTIVRRAERNVVQLLFLNHLKREEPLIYLNRLSSLLYVLAKFSETQKL
jgi:cob(I)alamin adenosyltransferase